MRPRLFLLGGQTIALGLTMAFLVVPASSIFLATYGAQALPYTYLCVAVAGVVVSALMARAQKRWSLARVTVLVLASYTILVSAAWAALSLAGATWVTFPLVVLFPLAIPVGFVLIGTQAGRLLDVRQMKAYFPRVVAGFSVGFAVGGIVAARLVTPLGGPEHLFGLDTFAALSFLVLAILTARRYPDVLDTPPPPALAIDKDARRDDHPGIRSLLRNRLVVMIFGYQLLSAAVTQLLDFMVWERAADRYPDPSDLARFLGIFGAVINIVSVAFVALLAGRLLTRYGIRLGLAANPAGVLVLLITSAIAGYVGGAASTVFFLLVCAQQVTDITLTDGTTRTSINATYQALPAKQRIAAQTWVEGVGFPLALGFVGLLLIATNAINLSIVSLVVITAILTAAWLVLGLAAYRGYGTSLRHTLTRRAWDPVALRLDDESRVAVERLASSDSLGDLRLGLDLLTDTDDPSLPERVRILLDDPDPTRRLVAVSVAARAIRASVDDSWVRPALEPLVADPDESVRSAVEITLADTGSDAAQHAARVKWANDLLSDDPARQRTAIAAAAASPDPVYVPSLLALAEAAGQRSGLAEALAANADDLAPLVDAALDHHDSLSTVGTRRLLGALGESGSPVARSVLLRHLDHHDHEIADAALAALMAGGAVTTEQRPRVRTALSVEAERTARVLAAVTALAAEPWTDHVIRGLHDESARSRRRAIALLGLLHDPTSLMRTVGLLDSDEGHRPLALETLEVTVGRSAFPLCLALLDPQLHDAERRDQLATLIGSPAVLGSTQTLVELIDDPADYWRDAWLRACALYALAGVDPARAREAAAGWLDDPDSITAETATWVNVMTSAARQT